MGNTSDETNYRWAAFDAMKEERATAATMCALYTSAGLYDLAKERADQWRRLDVDVREELYRLTDYLIPGRER